MTTLSLRPVDLTDDGEFKKLRLMYLHCQMSDMRGSQNFVTPFSFGRGDLYREKMQTRQRELGAISNISFIVTPESEIVGFVAAKSATKTFGTNIGALDQIFIVHDWRGKGCGAQTLELIQNWMRGMGANKAILGVGRKNYAAIKSYEGAGWKLLRPMHECPGHDVYMKELVV